VSRAPSTWDRERAIRLADIAREDGLDLATSEGWRAALARFNEEARARGGWTVDPPARPLQALAVEARAAMCRHGLDPAVCQGEQHHVWPER
jgi:hypothetical protein